MQTECRARDAELRIVQQRLTLAQHTAQADRKHSATVCDEWRTRTAAAVADAERKSAALQTVQQELLDARTRLAERDAAVAAAQAALAAESQRAAESATAAATGSTAARRFEVCC
jgi:predicted phage gp36 major capsid-like protein